MNYTEGLKTQKVYAQVKVNASSEEVWKVISMPGNLNYCHPFCKSNQVEKWGGIGAIDFIEYYNGLHLKRIFKEWNEGKGYELIIGNGKQASAKVKWEIKPINEGESYLVIRINIIPSIALKPYPKILRGIISKLYLMPNMRSYLSSVVNGFKYYIETGKEVKVNQFGYNKMFSLK
ncbi:MAG: hypothetical protein MK226_11210 [Saprospiraceae bacterium]|nr:hypothetical protein [Saprospiraceae bacterium]